MVWLRARSASPSEGPLIAHSGNLDGQPRRQAAACGCKGNSAGPSPQSIPALANSRQFPSSRSARRIYSVLKCQGISYRVPSSDTTWQISLCAPFNVSISFRKANTAGVAPLAVVPVLPLLSSAWPTSLHSTCNTQYRYKQVHPSYEVQLSGSRVHDDRDWYQPIRKHPTLLRSTRGSGVGPRTVPHNQCLLIGQSLLDGPEMRDRRGVLVQVLVPSKVLTSSPPPATGI